MGWKKRWAALGFLAALLCFGMVGTTAFAATVTINRDYSYTPNSNTDWTINGSTIYQGGQGGLFNAWGIYTPGWNANGGNSLIFTGDGTASGSGTINIPTTATPGGSGNSLTITGSNYSPGAVAPHNIPTIGANNTISIGYGSISMNSGWVAGTINALFGGNESTTFRQTGGTYAGNINMSGANDVFWISGNAVFQGNAAISGNGGHDVIVDVATTVTGKIDMSGTTGGVNEFFLANGNILADVIGSTGASNLMYVGNVPGYAWYNNAINDTIKANLNVKQIYGNADNTTVYVTSGQMYNFWAGVTDNLDPTAADTIIAGTTVNFLHGKGNSNNYNYQTSEDFDYIVYSLLGAGTVNVGAPGGGDQARVIIGAISGASNDNTYVPVTLSGDYYNGRQAQITADTVNVFANSKLTIHENADVYGDPDPLAATDPERNVIDKLNIIGNPGPTPPCNDCGYTDDWKSPDKAVVTIDRTTIYTLTAGSTITTNNGYGGGNYTANVVVGPNGILQGFGEIESDTDHTAKRPNVIGDVAVLAGGMLRPFDPEIFQIQWDVGNSYATNVNNVGRLKGLYFGVEGTLTFEGASRLSTRLFAEEDGNNTLVDVISDGLDSDGTNYVPRGDRIVPPVTRYLGDAVAADTLNFDEIRYNSIYNPASPYYPTTTPPYQTYGLNTPEIYTGVRQVDKIQYVPVFGFNYELVSKLGNANGTIPGFEIYQGTENGVQTYYYRVAEVNPGGAPIAALAGMDDANHLFNRDILRSDMLGNWSFLKQEDANGDSYGVVLRYRMLAEHPQNGGIAAVVNERNAYEAAKKLDEIRYPFWTPTSAADPTLAGVFARDPSIDNADPNYLYPGQFPSDPYNSGTDAANPYNQGGFSGDLYAFYSNPTAYGYATNPFRSNPAVDPNYDMRWVTDIEQYFRALQLEATSAADIYRAVRLVTAEAYASQASADLVAMNQFIASRERNAVSALYLVEEANKSESPDDGKTQFQRGLEQDMPTSFVANPLRVWTAALGNRSKQRRSGDEYGYSSQQNFGLQVGVIKEAGDLYFGLTGGYLRSTNRWSELQAKNKSDNYMAEALLGVRRGMGFAELTLNGGYMDHKMNRNIELGEDLSGAPYNPYLDCDPLDNYYNGVYRALQTGNFHNRVLGGGLRFGYQKVFAEKWLFLPTIGIRYQDIRNASAFTEDGPERAAFRLIIPKGGIKRQALQIPVMLRLGRGIAFNSAGSWILAPEVRVGATANAMDRGGKVNYQWIGNPIPRRVMKAWGLEEDRVTYQAGATLEVSRRGRFYAAVNYDINLWNKSTSHSFSFQSGLNF